MYILFGYADPQGKRLKPVGGFAFRLSGFRLSGVNGELYAGFRCLATCRKEGFGVDGFPFRVSQFRVQV